MIDVKDKKKCCGCGACYNACPKNAIRMVSDNEGFLYPKIDSSKCIKCGLCKKACPLLNKIDNNNSNNPKVYASWSNDSINRKTSSSGGIFYEIAKYFISKNGVVFGAGYDENLNVLHKSTDNLEDLLELKCSKYVQSDLNDCYKKIRQILIKKKLVLFVGSPCQVAGLYSFLGNKKYENLYTIDFVCHGVPSPKVYRKHLDELEKKYNSKSKSIYFRDKSKGWKIYSFKVKFDNGKEYSKILTDDTFIRGFLNNIYLRPSCHNCKFAKIPRISDITLGDFWGIGCKNQKLDDDKGTSQVLINSDKGKYLFDIIFDDIFVEEVDLEFGIKVNPCLVSSVKPNINREKFFEDLDNYDMKSLEKEYFPKPNIIIRISQYIKNGLRKVVPSSLKNKIKRILK